MRQQERPCAICTEPIKEAFAVTADDADSDVDSLDDLEITATAAHDNRPDFAPLSTQEPSTKFKALVNDLLQIRDNDDLDPSQKPTKSVIFSQWTQVLNLLEPHLKKNGIGYTRLDGSMTVPTRQAQIERFKTDPSARVLLISLKAGGVGLNLTVASRAYLLDPWWYVR